MKHFLHTLVKTILVFTAIAISWQQAPAQQTEPSDATTIKQYLWDNSTIPANEYEVFAYFTYKTTGYSGSVDCLPEFSPSATSVKGRYFNCNHENGIRELTLLYAHLLPSTSILTDDMNMFHYGRFFIIKNRKSGSSSPQLLYYPTRPENWDTVLVPGAGETLNENGDIVDEQGFVTMVKSYELETKSDVTYYGLSSREMVLDNPKGKTIDDPYLYIWELDEVDHYVIDTDHKVFNVAVTIGFDIDDEDYENPKYIRLSYDHNPTPSIIGTLSQTSELYNREKDNIGGWKTWVPLTPTGSDENPYPYVYDFTAQSEEYDLSFTFDNTRLLNM